MSKAETLQTFHLPSEVDQQVVVYTTPICGYCFMAMRLLDDLNVDYVKIDVAGDPEARSWLQQTTKQSTVPQIFIEGRSIGGYQELRKLVAQDDLARFRRKDESSAS